MRTILCSVILSALTTTAALAWSHEGHEVVGDVALRHLSQAASNAVMAIILNTSKVAEVTSILGAATWPDDIRDPNGVFHSTTAAQDFKTRFPDHTAWHFDDYPLEGVAYSPNGPFSKPNDVVHEINRCIDVLEGKTNDLNSKEAMAWLVHLVGDLHQPMHAACGFYTFGRRKKITLHKTLSDPHTEFSDAGGNGLELTGGSTTTFHHFWDQDMVEANSSSETTLATMIEAQMTTLTFTPNSGPVRDWAANWLNDSLKVADTIYLNASGNKGTKGTDKHDPLQPAVTVHVPIAHTYKDDHKADALNQLTKAAHNLADMLNAIQWPQ